MHGIHHLDLVVSDLERSLAFYRDLLGPLGYVREGPIRGERGERVVYLGHIGAHTAIGLREARSDAHGLPYDRYAVGVHHVAFGAPSRDMVDERAAWLRERGAEIESEPAEYDYIPGYYAVFLFDPDGIKLEIVHVPEDPRLAAEVRRLAQRVDELEARRR
ncbi:MAG: glyoxylase family protein [Solirubrobacteraceae bacterium]|nr:glyoxylase family protein [Solirubrobacteraceae bacterium]